MVEAKRLRPGTPIITLLTKRPGYVKKRLAKRSDPRTCIAVVLELEPMPNQMREGRGGDLFRNQPLISEGYEQKTVPPTTLLEALV